MKETELQKAIINYLLLKGHFVWRTNSARLFIPNKDGKMRMIQVGIKGISDIIGILKGGRFIAIECKIKPNKPTFEQEQFIQRINELGGLAFVAWSLDDVRPKVDNLPK